MDSSGLLDNSNHVEDENTRFEYAGSLPSPPPPSSRSTTASGNLQAGTVAVEVGGGQTGTFDGHRKVNPTTNCSSSNNNEPTNMFGDNAFWTSSVPRAGRDKVQSSMGRPLSSLELGNAMLLWPSAIAAHNISAASSGSAILASSESPSAVEGSRAGVTSGSPLRSAVSSRAGGGGGGSEGIKTNSAAQESFEIPCGGITPSRVAVDRARSSGCGSGSSSGGDMGRTYPLTPPSPFHLFAGTELSPISSNCSPRMDVPFTTGTTSDSRPSYLKPIPFRGARMMSDCGDDDEEALRATVPGAASIVDGRAGREKEGVTKNHQIGAPTKAGCGGGGGGGRGSSEEVKGPARRDTEIHRAPLLGECRPVHNDLKVKAPTWVEMPSSNGESSGGNGGPGAGAGGGDGGGRGGDENDLQYVPRHRSPLPELLSSMLSPPSIPGPDVMDMGMSEIKCGRNEPCPSRVDASGSGCRGDGDGLARAQLGEQASEMHRVDLCDPAWSLNPVLTPMPLLSNSGEANEGGQEVNRGRGRGNSQGRLVAVAAVNPEAQAAPASNTALVGESPLSSSLRAKQIARVRQADTAGDAPSPPKGALKRNSDSHDIRVKTKRKTSKTSTSKKCRSPPAVAAAAASFRYGLAARRDARSSSTATVAASGARASDFSSSSSLGAPMPSSLAAESIFPCDSGGTQGTRKPATPQHGASQIRIDVANGTGNKRGGGSIRKVARYGKGSNSSSSQMEVATDIDVGTTAGDFASSGFSNSTNGNDEQARGAGSAARSTAHDGVLGGTTTSDVTTTPPGDDTQQRPTLGLTDSFSTDHVNAAATAVASATTAVSMAAAMFSTTTSRVAIACLKNPADPRFTSVPPPPPTAVPAAALGAKHQTQAHHRHHPNNDSRPVRSSSAAGPQVVGKMGLSESENGGSGLSGGGGGIIAGGSGFGVGGEEQPRLAGKALNEDMFCSPADGDGGNDSVGGSGGRKAGYSAGAWSPSIGATHAERLCAVGDVVAKLAKSGGGGGSGGSKKSEKSARPPCTCKKCKCLKLYCECFTASRFCGPTCLCNDCHNTPNEETLLAARRNALERKPNAFQRAEMLNKNPSSVLEGAGCGCMKSQCLKKYCVCYNKGVGCGASCKCEGCLNTPGDRRHGAHIFGSSGNKNKKDPSSSSSSSNSSSQLQQEHRAKKAKTQQYRSHPNDNKRSKLPATTVATAAAQSARSTQVHKADNGYEDGLFFTPASGMPVSSPTSTEGTISPGLPSEAASEERDEGDQLLPGGGAGGAGAGAGGARGREEGVGGGTRVKKGGAGTTGGGAGAIGEHSSLASWSSQSILESMDLDLSLNPFGEDGDDDDDGDFFTELSGSSTNNGTTDHGEAALMSHDALLQLTAPLVSPPPPSLPRACGGVTGRRGLGLGTGAGVTLERGSGSGSGSGGGGGDATRDRSEGRGRRNRTGMMARKGAPKRRQDVLESPWDEHLPGAKVFGPRCHRLVKRPADISLSFLDNDDLYNASLVNWVWSSLAMGPALWENRG